MNRSELQDKYIHADIDAMDLDDMYTILYDLLEEKVSKLSDEELMEDVKEYHSHLLEEWVQLPKCHNGVDTVSTPSYTNHIPNNTNHDHHIQRFHQLWDLERKTMDRQRWVSLQHCYAVRQVL